MAILNSEGIYDGATSKAEHITRVIDSLNGTATTTIVATGSFTGSFTGDGSNITGVTAEWDGTHVGNASITGSLTVTNTVSGSFVGEGNLTGSFTGSFTGDGSALTGVSTTSQINLHFNTLGSIGTVSPSVNYYFGNDSVLNQNSASINAQFIPYDGQVKSVIVRNILTGVSDTPHLALIQFYNFTTNTSSSLAVSLAHDTRLNVVARSGSSTPVSAGDRVMIKVETPAFGTNPTNAYYFADVLIEKT